MNTDHLGTAGHSARRWWVRAIAVVAGLAVVAITAGVAVVNAKGPRPRPPFPRNAAMETTVGVQFVRATLVADGGLLDVRYIVLDSPRAQRWLANTAKPPRLVDKRNNRVIDRAAPMRDAHSKRAGQTYYIIYQNTGNALHRGDLVTLTVAGVTLNDVPVE